MTGSGVAVTTGVGDVVIGAGGVVITGVSVITGVVVGSGVAVATALTVTLACTTLPNKDPDITPVPAFSPLTIPFSIATY